MNGFFSSGYDSPRLVPRVCCFFVACGDLKIWGFSFVRWQKSMYPPNGQTFLAVLRCIYNIIYTYIYRDIDIDIIYIYVSTLTLSNNW